MSHSIQCTCGAVRGALDSGAPANHCVCYCASCQAFAHYLERSDAILNAAGGTEIIQTQPRHLRIERGTEHLACVRLTAKGPLRWYTDCCRTPIGNTLASNRLAFLGLIHSCLDSAGADLDQTFGPVRMVVHTDGAKGSPKPEAKGLAAGLARVAAHVVSARLTGAYRDNPLFDPENGRPIATPRELTAEERAELYTLVSTTR